MNILVADDEYVTLTGLVGVLAAYGTCDVATNGTQAIEMYTDKVDHGRGYELAVLDIEMPGVGGLNVLKFIRQREQLRQTASTRVIITSATANRANVTAAAERRCDAFLVKPVSPEKLVQTLEKLGLAAARSAAADPAAADPAPPDPAAADPAPAGEPAAV